MAAPVLNESSVCWIKAKFFTRFDLAQIPSAVQYRLDCETTGQVILDWTTVTTAAALEVEVTAVQNVIINDRNLVERKVMTVMANSDSTTERFNDQIKWDVLNQQGQT